MSENAKTKIKFEHEGIEYCLEYTADSLKKMEKSGFSFTKIEDNALTAPEELFYGAFIANHVTTPLRKKKEIYKALVAECDGETLTDALGEMISEAIEELTNKKSGNVKWRIEK